MIKLNGSVGAGGQNKPSDVAVIQVLLKNTRGAKSYFADIPSGFFGEDLATNIEQFQIDNGLLKANGGNAKKGLILSTDATLKKLMSKTSKDLHALKVLFVNQFYPVFFCQEKALDSVPEIPSPKDLRLPDLMVDRVQAFLKKAIVGFSVQSVDISNEGQFCVALKTKEKFYDAGLNKVINKPSTSYIKYVLKNIAIKEFSVDITSAGILLLKSKKISFFAGPHSLNQNEKQRLKHWSIPSSGKMDFDTYQRKLISSAIRPWRKIKRASDADFYDVPQGLIKPSSKQYAFLASQALAHYGDHSGINHAYTEITRRQGFTGRRQPLILVYISAEFQIILGVSLQVGVLLDPNTKKEYLYIKASFGVSASLGFGFSAGLEREDSSIEEVLAKQGGSSGISFSNELELGPLALKIQLKNERVKFPEVEWEGFRGIPVSLFGVDSDAEIQSDSFKISGDVGGDLDNRNFLSLAADTETGKRLENGEKSASEKRNEENSSGSKVKRKLSALDYRILHGDVGAAAFEVVLKPKLSGKIKVEFGPEAHFDYLIIKELDIDFGWFEDATYSLLRAYLPRQRPLFPLT